MLALLLFLACTSGDATLDSTSSDTSSDTPSGTVDASDTDSDSVTDGVSSTADTAGSDTGTPPEGLVDFRQRGPYGTQTLQQTVVTSCSMAATAHVPQAVDAPAVVVLSHGFARDRAKVADLADHMASWGLTVVRPDLCHAGPIGVDHEQNGVDLAALGAQLSEGRPVYYVGHSAGGLASLLAATQSPEAAGHLGLDTVDVGGLGLAAAPGLTLPTGALIGMAEPCNSGGNAVGVYAAVPDARVLRLPGADHCDFESPTDALCTTFCADGSGPEPQTPELIIALATAWVAWRAGLAPGGEAWWDAEGLDELVSGGSVEVVR